jgi:DNA-binding transcriptional LysR family regulator
VNLDLRQIRAFDAVARCGGFSRASQEVGLTQPTLSTHIRNLERQLGVRLFDRSGRTVNLTPAGRILADYAGRIMDLCRESLQAIESFTGEIRGTVHVDASTVPGEYILPRWLNSFHIIYPEVLVILTVSDSLKVLEKVAAGEVSLGVAGSRGNHPSLESKLLCEDRIVLVAAPGLLPGRDGRSLSVGDLPGLPLIRREPGSGTQIAIETALLDHDIEPDSMTWVVTLGSTRAVIEGALAGLGAAFLSQSTVTREIVEGGLKTIDFPELRIRRGFYVVTNTRRTLSPAAERFRDQLLRADGHLLSGD